MNKWCFFAVFCCILLLCALPAMAQEEQALPVITITYAAGAPLSPEEAVDAQVTIARDGQEHAFSARLRLNAAAMDSEERELPQRSLYIKGADMRFVLYNDGGDAIYIIDQVKDPRHTDSQWLENLAVSEALRRLTEREQRILRMRFFEGRTQMEVAGEIGISQAQVSRLEKNALQHMRKYVSES